jgi:hypothetical protein
MPFNLGSAKGVTICYLLLITVGREEYCIAGAVKNVSILSQKGHFNNGYFYLL